MTKERDSKMKLIINESVITEQSSIEEPIENKVYQSDPIKSDLLSKLHAFRKSQKKFNVQDLIKDRLK